MYIRTEPVRFWLRIAAVAGPILRQYDRYLEEQAIMSKKRDPLVEAIRQDPTFGEGSCSVVDECYTDEELLTALREAGVSTRPAALRWARQRHESFLEREQDCQFE